MFNPQLQTGVYSAQPVAAPDGVAAAASLGSTLMDLGQTFFQAQSQRELAELKQQELAQKQLADQQALQSVEDISGVVNFFVDIDANENRVAATRRLQEEWRSIRDSGKYSETQLAQMDAEFKKRTGRNLSSAYLSASEEQDKLSTLQEKQQQEAQTAVAFVSQFRGRYQAETQEFLNPDGSIKQDLSPEQTNKMIQIGRSIEMREAADLAAINAMENKTAARSKIESRNLALAIDNAILDQLDTIKSLPLGQGIALLDETFAKAKAGIAVNMNLLPEDRQAQEAAMNAVYNYYRDGLSGARTAQAQLDVSNVQALNVYNQTLASSDTAQAIAALQAAKIPLGPEETAAMRGLLISQVQANANAVVPPPGTSVDADGNFVINGKNTGVKFSQIKADEWKRQITPIRPVDPNKTFMINGQEKTQAQIYTDQLIVGLTPVTAEQKQSFFGQGGTYLATIDAWSKNPEALENISAGVLSNPDVRSAVVRSNSEAVAQYLPNVMQTTTYPGMKIVADVVTVTVDAKGYPVLAVPEYLKGGAKSPTTRAVDNVNRLFKLQHEAAVNISKVTGDESIVKDTVAAQMQALAQYSQFDERAAALSGLFEE